MLNTSNGYVILEDVAWTETKTGIYNFFSKSPPWQSVTFTIIYYNCFYEAIIETPPSSGKWAITAAAVCNHLANTSCPGQQCEQGNNQIGLTDLCGCIHTGTSLDQLRDNLYMPFFGSEMESIQPILVWKKGGGKVEQLEGSPSVFQLTKHMRRQVITIPLRWAYKN